MNSFLKIHSEQKNLDTEKMPAEPFHVNKSLEKPNTQWLKAGKYILETINW